MTTYLLSLASGALIGLMYSLLKVRPPAPPIIALIGLLGMVLGGQIMPVAQRVASTETPIPAVQKIFNPR